MRKIIVLLLVFALVFSVCACGIKAPSTTSDNSDSTSDNTSTTEQNVDTPSPTKAPEEVNATPNEHAENTSKPDTIADVPTALTYVIEDEIIVDNEICTFKITKAEVDRIWGFTLKAFCENKTTDKNLMFTIDDVSVNGYMVDPFWADEIAPGKKANDDINFSSSSFDEIGIKTADEITFTLRVYDYDDWSADHLVEDVFSIYPTGLSADEIVYPARKTSASEQVVVDNDDFCFVIIGQSDDSFWGYTLQCYIENKTNNTLMFSWDEVSVNGFMIDPFWAREVAPQMRSYADISFSSSDFEDNDITDVEDIEYCLRVYDSDDWSGNDYINETFTYKP